MIQDIVINKKEVIKRCNMRIVEVYDNNIDNLMDLTKQDSVIMNIQRSLEACLDLAMHRISVEKLGVPQNGRDAFEILLKNGYIDETILNKMKSMIGFRNLAVHDYQKLNLEVLQSILEKHLYDFEDFSSRF